MMRAQYRRREWGIEAKCPLCFQWQFLREGPEDYTINEATGDVHPMFVCMMKHNGRYCECAGDIRLVKA
jgi:hypothetical protein